MKRRRLFPALIACSSALFVCTGCSGLFPSPEYHEPSTYDLRFPEVWSPLPFPLIVRSFSSDTSARYKMLFRDGERVVPNEFARWSRIPSEMLTRYCRIAFSRSTDRTSPAGMPSHEFVLSGTVLAFEADMTDKVCRLYVKCALSRAENDSRILWGRTYYITASAAFTPDSPGKGAAAAMRRAAEIFIRDLYRDLSALDLSKAEENTDLRKENYK